MTGSARKPSRRNNVMASKIRTQIPRPPSRKRKASVRPVPPSPHYSRRCRFRVPAVVNRIVNEGAGGVGREWRPCRNAGS